ncbi:MAG: hypothetical protein WBB28_26010 [Crinalium sp.]
MGVELFSSDRIMNYPAQIKDLELGSREVITNLSLPSETEKSDFHRTRLLNVSPVVKGTSCLT